VTRNALPFHYNVFNPGLWNEPTIRGLSCTAVVWQPPGSDVKARKQSTFSSDSKGAADFKYSISGKVISITYSGPGSINQEIGRIMRRIEHWHQGSVESYRILYQNADGLGGEVKWDGEKAEVTALPTSSP
jgi:hypothetical protein